MTQPEYPGCLRELIESEVFGEAVSLALLAVAKNERDRHQFATLLQLETETKARLRPLLYKHEVSLAEEAPHEQIAGIVQGYLEAPWEAFAEANKAVVQDLLERFEAIAAVGPAEDRELLAAMVEHEKAILRWFDMESRGESQGSLDAMVAQLRYPIPG